MPYRETPFRAGEYYHLYNRGCNFQPIFLEQDNYRHFFWLIRQHLLSDVALVAYCFMPNHYHLLVQLLSVDLSQRMQAFGVAYTKAINKRHGRVGPLFQGRFRAIHVDRDEYLLQLSRYIHLNPVAARLVERPEAWQFSSCQEYFSLRANTLLCSEIVLAQFGSHADYQRFVEADARDDGGIRHLLLDDEGGSG
jgi:putative transposase